MRQRLAGVGAATAAAIGGLLLAPVFTTAVLAVPILVVCAVVIAVDQLALGRASSTAWRAALALLGGTGALAVVAARDGATAALPAGLITRSWPVILSSTWPVRDDPELYLIAATLVLIAAVAAVELLRNDLPVAATVPGLAVATLAQALAPATHGTALAAGVGLCGCATLMLLSGRTGATRTGGGWIKAAAVSGGTILAAAAAVWFVAPGAADARTLDRQLAEPESPPGVLNPLDEIADRLAEPGIPVFRNRPSAPVDRWPLIVLDTFDGDSWTTGAGYRPLGARLGTQTGQQHAQVQVTGLTGPWLPTPGRVVSLTTADQAGQALVNEPTGAITATTPIRRYDVGWRPERDTPGQLRTARTVPGPAAVSPPGLPEPFADLARGAVGAGGSPFETALALENHLRARYRLASGTALPAGHGYAQLDWFLHHSRRGTSEQFATAYALLARSLGLPVRLVVGFRQPPRPDRDGFYTVRNGDVLAWPEINLDGPGWVALDPTAQTDSERKTAAADTGPVQPVPQPSVPVAEPSLPPSVAQQHLTRERDSGATPAWWFAGAGLLLALLLPAGVPLVKMSRARRRRSGAAAAVVAGAVAEVRDRLRDHRVAVSRGATLRELADTAAVLGADARTALADLAGCADRALWSGRRPQPSEAAEAWFAVATVSSSLRRLPLPTRIRAAVHLGSFRAGRRP
ncbi:MAG: transglutaminaseTgpA domain-containing protein [Actinoplanes sp.]